MRTLVLFHAACNDGFCAAWVYRRCVDPQAEFKAIQYGWHTPDVAGRRVVMLDFSYPRPQLLALREAAASLLVIDHHETAARELAGLDFCVFALERSAARLTWEHFFDPRQQASVGTPPWLVAYTEDRDLWRWKLPDSRAVNAALGSYPRRFEVWDEIAARGAEELATEGRAILRYEHRLIRPRVRNHGWTTIAGMRVPAANATCLTSEIGNALSNGHPFAAVFFVLAGGRVVYNLRSDGDEGADVGEIARGYGGGGHRNAAAFTLDHMLPLEPQDADPSGRQESGES